jgi:hypothetical protein
VDPLISERLVSRVATLRNERVPACCCRITLALSGPRRLQAGVGPLEQRVGRHLRVLSLRRVSETQTGDCKQDLLARAHLAILAMGGHGIVHVVPQFSIPRCALLCAFSHFIS